MECPECGFLMDAFDVECPRCKRMGTQSNRPPTAEPVATAAPGANTLNRPAYPVQQAGYAKPAGYAAHAYAFGLKQIIALAAGIILIVGVFMPILNMWSFLSAPTNVNLLQIATALHSMSTSNLSLNSAAPAASGGDALLLFFQCAGYVIILLALMAIVASLARWYVGLWISGLSSFSITAFIIIFYFVKISTANAAMHDAAAKYGAVAATFISKMPSLFAIAPLGWGALVLLIGAIILITSAALVDPNMA